MFAIRWRIPKKVAKTANNMTTAQAMPTEMPGDFLGLAEAMAIWTYRDTIVLKFSGLPEQGQIKMGLLVIQVKLARKHGLRLRQAIWW